MRKDREQNQAPKKSLFIRFAEGAAALTGRPISFLLAVGVIALWLVSGPAFGFSNTWQLLINTGTTIVTLLMVFLIQNTQNREAVAVQLKLDELIRATEGAHTVLLDIEELSDHELRKIREKYERIAAESRARLRDGGMDTNRPDVALDADLNPDAPPVSH